ncbi:MAG: multiheme c-type cytochrome [Acidobacteriota bacterium]|nr:multiheme c-type cytochrome [Acidobacteriota bacterium]
MTLDQKRWVIGGLGFLFLLSLVAVQWLEVSRRRHEESGGRAGASAISVPDASRQCVDCHAQVSTGIVDHWKGSTHAEKGVACLDCHKAGEKDADMFNHYGRQIATIVTPRDCAACHPTESAQFAVSHHAKAGSILATLDNFLAETVSGSRQVFSPHSPTPGRAVNVVNGMAPANSGCQQCHGSLVAFQANDGGLVTMHDLKPDDKGQPTNPDAVGRIVRNESGKPLFSSTSWPNTGIGRMNLDGSLGSCAACHSRHDFSARRARQPENCAKCHLGPAHPQKEIYDESKHGVAFRDLIGQMNLDAKPWVVGRDYSAAPTCATCHMSANIRNGMKITHDPGERISWTNRPPVSLVMDTDANHEVVTETDPEKRRAAIADTADAKRNRMKQVCSTCHTPDYINLFYRQYDDVVINYNEKFAKPGQAIMAALTDNGLLTKTQYDEPIEWTWYYLWHHEGRRARMGASMMAPDYTQWRGMFEVAQNFYMKLIPEARAVTAAAARTGKAAAARAADATIDEILRRPEHQWLLNGAEAQADAIQQEMQRKYGQGRR